MAAITTIIAQFEENYLNDLWCYDPSNNQWTWLKGNNIVNQSGVYGTQGVAATANTPGARNDSAAWTYADGKCYLFGGNGYDGSGFVDNLNDLWCYNPSNNKWTWLKGSKVTDQPGVYGTPGVAATGNTPGARDGSAVFTDAKGKVYLFGG